MNDEVEAEEKPAPVKKRTAKSKGMIIDAAEAAEAAIEESSVTIGSGAISVVPGGGITISGVHVGGSGTLPSPITWSPSTTTPTPTWGSGIGTLPSPTAPRITPKPSVVLDAPTRRPKKILIAFLDDDDEVTWCAKVHPNDIDVDMNPAEAAPRMNLGFWLIDAQ